LSPSNYETQQIQRVLEAEGLERVEPKPGEPLGFIKLIRLPVFVKGEWVPPQLNFFHSLSREEVIRRELLLKIGEPLRQEQMEESARNLRNLGIFSLAVLLPVRPRGAEELGLLLLTRDLWSLRLESSFQLTAGTIDDLNLQLTERNLLGRNKQAAISFEMDPLRYQLGELYADHRLLGDDLSFNESLKLHFQRGDQSYEGISLNVKLSQPFRNLSQPWGFSLPLSYSDRSLHYLQGGVVYLWDDPETGNEEDPQVEQIPMAWEQRSLSFSFLMTRQLEGYFTQRFSVGLGFSQSKMSAGAEVPEAHRASFERNLLFEDRRLIYPNFAWRGFARRYRRWRDLAAYSLSEDLRLGPSISLGCRLPSTLLGSTENALLPQAALSWTEALWEDGLLDLGLGLEARGLEQGWVDRRLLLRWRMASPMSPYGRLFMRTDWLLRGEESHGVLISLGGDNGLRGYPSAALLGFDAQRLRSNLEWRSAPLIWSFLHLGGVLFYDAGSLYGGREQAPFVWRQAVGVGLRLLLPQLNRSIFRFDLGVPLGEQGLGLSWSLGSSQMLPMPGREDLLFESNTGGLLNQP